MLHSGTLVREAKESKYSVKGGEDGHDRQIHLSMINTAAIRFHHAKRTKNTRRFGVDHGSDGLKKEIPWGLKSFSCILFSISRKYPNKMNPYTASTWERDDRHGIPTSIPRRITLTALSFPSAYYNDKHSLKTRPTQFWRCKPKLGFQFLPRRRSDSWMFIHFCVCLVKV